jgi:uncharacterized membrane protein YeaQ/YmgE (transglycosylase-associated protein family)
MESLLPLIIQAVSGAAGGNIIGQVLKNMSLGTTGNTIAGAVGGVGGGWLLNLLSSGALSGIIGQIGGGGIGGIILTAIAGYISNMNKN